MYDYISVLIWIRNSLLLLLLAVWNGFGPHGADETKLGDAFQLQISSESVGQTPIRSEVKMQEKAS